jgi:hypothetical protein
LTRRIITLMDGSALSVAALVGSAGSGMLGSGGRLLYRKQTTKATLNPKVLTGLLASHLKSETAAAEAIKYIVENREARPRESLLYEKN